MEIPPSSVRYASLPATRGRVWLVDDSPLEGELVRVGLIAEHDVFVFESAAPMLERLAAGERPDVLVLDWHMPEISGLEACEFVRENIDEASLPILILTASDSREDLSTGLTAGANDFLRKPFYRPELIARVGALLRLRRLHARVHAAEAELRREARFREEFLAILAHDLRQPLNVVALAGEVLGSASTSANTRTSVAARVLGAASRMQRMIDELLDFSRARPAGGVPIARKHVDLALIVDEVVGEIRLANPSCSVDVMVTGSCEGIWDGDRLAQVVSNLVENALAHSPVGSPIDITLSCDGDLTVFAVANAGTTIPPEELPTLFDAFRRGTSRSKNQRGLGLGLYIVAEITKAHGGTATARSENGQTRFAVSLPNNIEIGL